MSNRGAYGYTQPAEQGSFKSSQSYPPQADNYHAVGERPKSRKRNKWLWIGLPILLIVVILAAVLGGVLGSRSSSDGSDGTSARDNGSNNGGSGTSTTTTRGTDPWISGAATDVPNNVNASVVKAATAAAKAGGNDDLLYAGTDIYSNPIFKTAASKASSPTLNGNNVGNCASDPWSATNSVTDLRPHPRLIGAEYQWDCLPSKIQNDAYLTAWNASIFNNATNWADQDPVPYAMDGGSGILDSARDVQQRLKAWGYAWRLSKDQKWIDRAFQEMQYVAGNTSGSGWVDWNVPHFLDTAELSAAFGLAYDWMYDGLSDDQRQAIMWTLLTRGLQEGANQYSSNAWFFQPVNGNGNWNCVTNGGLLVGALAVQSEDPTGTASSVIENAIGNFGANCMRGVYEDGTWSETPNYWYFGTNAHARAVSSLITATGSDQGLMAMNQDFTKTGLFHMYVSGNGGMFAYGDNGPNKYATTANQMFFYANQESNPLYSLFQRDRADAADPLSMLWYQPATKGAFWDGLPLDRFFSAENGSWVSMRSSWTDFTGTYVAMKSSILTDHQTHGDLDVGDFVIDAMGTRWAGEFGNANYLSTDYFASEAQDALRWGYYRKGTQGQNTLVIGNQNQRVTAQPKNRFESTNAAQTVDIAYKPGTNDVAYFVTDMSSAYSAADGAIQRGIRMLNGRRQVLVQDEIASSVTDSILWQVHTNATITLSSDKRTATMKIKDLKGINAGFQVDGSLPQEQTMIAKILEPSGATFDVTTPPARLYGSDPNTASGEDGDQPNPGISVLSISLDGGSDQTISVVWQPQWADLSDADKADPKSVPLAQWSTTSHNA